MFRFKEFAIEQSRAAMKVGTDGVLLGAWTDIEPQCRRILDIGTGTALIALMMAQRASQAHITAIDIDAPSVEDARLNVAKSPWSDRVEVVEGDVVNYLAETRFDLIVTNPPYFISSLHSPERSRSAARHSESLPFNLLVGSVVRLLRDGGHFSLILPEDEGNRFRRMACEQLSLTRLTEVWSTPKSGVKRLLMEFIKGSSSGFATDRLIISDGDFTPEYRELTKDFYLKF